jgi:hypothetical protein
MELVILCCIFEGFVRLFAALCAENTELFLSHLPEELRSRLLTALWAGNSFAHGLILAGPMSGGVFKVKLANENKMSEDHRERASIVS